MSIFDEKRGEKLKQQGMEQAADNARDYLHIAREVAQEIAKGRFDRCVTADDVGRVMKVDYGIDTLGPAAGSLFKTNNWKWTGEFRKSKRVTNHSRLLRVWQYIGE